MMKTNKLLTTLFGLVLIVSLIWHLPARWVFDTAQLANHLPPPWQVSQISGYWWQGQAQLARSGRQPVLLGQVHWQWHPSALLQAKLGLALRWQLDAQKSNGLPSPQFRAQLRVDATTIEITELNGQAQFKALANLDAATQILNDVEGAVALNNVSLVVPITQPLWLNAIAGQVQLSKVAFMGASVPSLSLTPSMDKEQIKLDVLGQGEGWQLSGQSWLGRDSFGHNLTLNAQSPKDMPDWASLMMRSTSNTQAVLQARGRY